MSYIDVLYWGLLLVAFLGFAAALLLLLAALVKPKSPHQTPCASHVFVADRIAERDGGK